MKLFLLDLSFFCSIEEVWIIVLYIGVIYKKFLVQERYPLWAPPRCTINLVALYVVALYVVALYFVSYNLHITTW